MPIRVTQPDDEDGKYWFDQHAADAVVAFFPRYLKHFKGEWAGKPFDLSPWQENIIRQVFGWKDKNGNRRYRTVYVWVPRKNGKLLDLDTPIPTVNGWKRNGDLKKGDQIFAESGSVCNVVHAHNPVTPDQCYRVVFSDGTFIDAGDEHLWTIERKNPSAKWDIVTLTTQQIVEEGITINRHDAKNERKFRLKLHNALQPTSKELTIDPYLFGAWLGDGTSSTGSLTLNDRDRVEIVSQFPDDFEYSESCFKNSCARVTAHGLRSRLNWEGVINNKHIPNGYLFGDEHQRRRLLQGIVDTDGHVDRVSKVEITTVIEQLSKDITTLARSLGFKVSCIQEIAKLNGREIGPKWRINFTAYKEDNICTTSWHVNRLKPRPENPTRSRTVQITSINPIPTKPMRCITVDSPSSLYLAGEGMHQTHNSTLAAGVALAALMGDAEPGAEVYLIARTESQARIVYDFITQMISQDEMLSAKLTAFKTAVWCDELGAKIEPLTGKPKGKHGLNASCIIGDEMHEWDGDDLYTFVHQSEGTRRQPLDFLISTAGQREGVGYEHYLLCEAILEGEIYAPDTFVFIAAADAEKDQNDPKYWTYEETMADANPGYGTSVKPETMSSEVAKAISNPRKENDVKRYYLNLWVDQAVRWLNMARWDECGHAKDGPVGIKDIGLPQDKQPVIYRTTNMRWAKFEERFIGRRCLVGVDLSTIVDLTCASFVFPPDDNFPLWSMMPRFYLPKDDLEERTKRDKFDYQAAADVGALYLTDGEVVDYDFVREDIIAMSEKFQIAVIGIDRWNSTQIATQLGEKDLEVSLFGQGYASMSGPTKFLERIMLQKRLDHGGHPVLRWNARNAAVTRDAAENMKPVKDKSTGRIDGIVAGIIGIGIGDEYMNDDSKSVYDERGIL